MVPSKSWMALVDDDRLNPDYAVGVKKFLEFAFDRTGEKYEIRCPCVKCCNTYLRTRDEIETHLLVYGIIRGYTFWYHHGKRLGEPQSESDKEDDEELEESESDDNMQEMMREGCSSRVELEAQIREYQKENHSLKCRVKALESQMELNGLVQHLQSNVLTPSLS